MAKETTDFRQGDTKLIEITDTNIGFDVTGHTHWFTLRAEFDDVAFVAQAKSLAGAHSLDDIPNNKVYVQMESDVTINIPVGLYYWDLQRSDGGTPPVINTLLPTPKNARDRVEVLPHVTKVAV